MMTGATVKEDDDRLKGQGRWWQTQRSRKMMTGSILQTVVQQTSSISFSWNHFTLFSVN